MIKNIRRLKSFGIFEDYKSTGLQEFGKFNLIYGWNGCGKSTLSLLFEAIEHSRIPAEDKFPSAEFEIVTSSTTVTKENITRSTVNIRTFNQNFVDTNIDWDKSVKSILLVAQENIAEHHKLDALKKRQQTDIETFDKESQQIDHLDKEVGAFLTNSARQTKHALQVIDTSDNRYMNYNKAKLKAFIDENHAAVVSTSSVLGDQELVSLTNAARPDQKPEIKCDLRPIDVDDLEQAKSRLDDLLSERVTSQTIERLTTNSDIQSWVQTGIELHKTHRSETCEFCQNSIAASRLKELDHHFSDHFRKYKDRLTRAKRWLDDRYVRIEDLPFPSDVYEELRKDFEQAKREMNRVCEQVNTQIASWHDAVRRKIDNPFNTTIAAAALDPTTIRTLNAVIATLHACIDRHNSKSKNFAQETAKSKRKLELHYASAELQAFDYFGKLQAIEDRSQANDHLSHTIDQHKKDIQAIEATLSDERLGAEQFNKSLHKFLGRTDLNLRFNRDLFGYEIIRADAEKHDGNLSEGEKTAVAFVLFMTKLEESGNKLKDSIVVIDDPVSSFDSNHIFCAYSFLRNRCKDVKQLIVMTHNFTFFKLIRDWFVKYNNSRKNRKPPQPENAFFYVIETSANPRRESTIANAERSLIDYDSEYHYLFSKLYQYRHHTKLAADDAFLTANIARKLLESFFGFKYPRHRSDLDNLLTAGLTNCTNTTQDIKERVYRFINKYSHGGVIETNQDAAENLLGESGNVVKDIFTWVEEVDEVHYKEMVAVTIQ